MYNFVTPQEWELMEHMKNGEEIGNCDKTYHATLYEAYVESAKKCREWIGGAVLLMSVRQILCNFAH